MFSGTKSVRAQVRARTMIRVRVGPRGLTVGFTTYAVVHECACANVVNRCMHLLTPASGYPG